MSDEHDPEGSNESAGSLRTKLEAALAKNKALEGQVVLHQAEALIRDKGYTHLTAADLEGVSAEELATKAEEINARKALADAEAVKRVLASKGLTGEDLDKAVNDLVGSTDSDAAALERIAQARNISGDRPGTNKFEGKVGKDLLYAAYAD